MKTCHVVQTPGFDLDDTAAYTFVSETTILPRAANIVLRY
jgi:hypothetical protein